MLRDSIESAELATGWRLSGIIDSIAAANAGAAALKASCSAAAGACATVGRAFPGSAASEEGCATVFSSWIGAAVERLDTGFATGWDV